jgi:hypothetical protein
MKTGNTYLSTAQKNLAENNYSLSRLILKVQKQVEFTYSYSTLLSENYINISSLSRDQFPLKGDFKV